ncbi:c-type cytochrome [Vogesella facilis]|uniref:C-type cytochrome n=1 Tax=Vogesella facilis TaxID=1655232 RepID=A0ABV7RG58_9NEIS
MKKSTTALILALLCSSALASPGEDRQKSFKKVLLSFEPIGVMLRDGPFRQDQFIKHADALKAAAPAPFTLFKPNSIDDVSRAKTEIWSQPAKFKAEQDKFLLAVNALQAGARSDDLAAVRIKYSAVAQSCKSCHDGFRGPKK